LIRVLLSVGDVRHNQGDRKSLGREYNITT
jgi:hypothetical protein